MIEAVAGIPEGYPDNQLEQEYPISIRLGSMCRMIKYATLNMQGWTNIKIKFLYLYVKALRMIKEFNLKKVKLEIFHV